MCPGTMSVESAPNTPRRRNEHEKRARIAEIGRKERRGRTAEARLDDDADYAKAVNDGHELEPSEVNQSR